MSTYLRTRDAVLALRNALRPRHRSPKGRVASGFTEDRRRMRSLFSDSNLLGFGITKKVVENKPVEREFSLTFYVRRKLPKTRLEAESSIPKRFTVHSLASAVQTDIQSVGSMHVAHAGINSGSSIGHISGTAGSMTLVARDAGTQERVILSCSHVLARAGSAQQGDAIESPAYSSDGSSPQIVGHLTERFMVIDPQVYNTIDAALASPVDGMVLSNFIPGLGNITGVLDLSQMADQSIIGVPISKFGAATPLQSGQITGSHFTVQIRFPELGDKVAWFTDLLTHNILSKDGDSGAAIVETEGMNVVGMHIASAGPSGLCTNIQPVFDTLQITL